MADVKWIKILTDIFDDEKVLLIETLPEADSIIVIWFKLLCLAGKQNNSGVFMLNDRMPYNEKMFATIFRRKETVVTLALDTFENFGMIEIIDGAVTIPNWGKHQNLDKIEAKNEYMKGYMREYREKQKQLISDTNGLSTCKTNSKSNSKVNVSEAEKNYIENIDNIEKNEKREKPDPIPYQEIVDLFNRICTSLPQVQKLTGKRKQQIALRYKELENIDMFEQAFILVQESKFLTGDNERGWVAKFDWLMVNDTNIVKVLEGNYKNSKVKSSNPFKDILKEMMEDDEAGNSLHNDNNQDGLPKLLP